MRDPKIALSGSKLHVHSIRICGQFANMQDYRLDWDMGFNHMEELKSY
jgi:hypothetical protein